MNYEQKHQEDLEAAEGWLAIAKENNNTIAIQILENFFPELFESDDEKIRKEIISYIKSSGAVTNKDWIAWLEKQGKQMSDPRYSIHSDGKNESHREYDLFFADKEEDLTEFEKEVAEAYEWAKTTEREEFVNEFAPKLLDLARKEILESLPKWKKDSNNLSSLIYTLDNRGDGRIFLCRKGYAININELLNLPKEE